MPYTCPAKLGATMYGYMNSTTMGNDLSYLLFYANCVTHNMATIMITIAFFLIVFIGSLVMEQRFTGNMKPDTSLLAASFVTVGFELILMQKNLIPGWFFGITFGVLVLSFFLRALSSTDTP